VALPLTGSLGVLIFTKFDGVNSYVSCTIIEVNILQFFSVLYITVILCRLIHTGKTPGTDTVTIDQSRRTPTLYFEQERITIAVGGLYLLIARRWYKL